MKKLFFLLMAVLMLPVMALAQTVESAATIFNPAEYFASLGALVTGVLAVTEWLKRLLKTKGIGTKFLSWIVAICLSCFGWFFGLGILEGIEWYWMIGYAISSGLVANSIFDLQVVQAILRIFKL